VCRATLAQLTADLSSGLATAQELTQHARIPPFTESTMHMKDWNRVLLIAGLLTSASSSSSIASQNLTPKEECEALMNALVPLAEQLLSKHREFYPFGGTMSVDGKIALGASNAGKQHPDSQSLIDVLEQGFRDGAKRHLYKATAIIVNVRTIPPGKTDKQDAVEVRLDHVSGYSVRVLLPYAFSKGGKLEFAPSFATRGDGRVFGR
jgi:hypothetical protein